MPGHRDPEFVEREQLERHRTPARKFPGRHKLRADALKDKGLRVVWPSSDPRPNRRRRTERRNGISRVARKGQ